MKLQLTIAFDVEGDAPNAEQRDDLVQRIIEEWPNWVYEFGDSAATIEIVAEWLEVQL
jgi:hypothetical protein